MLKRYQWLSVLPVAVAAILIYWQLPFGKVQSQAASAITASSSSSTTPLSSLRPVIDTDRNETIKQSADIREDMAQIATWADTDIDGQLRVDASGRLVVDRELRDFMDYMLSAVGDLEPQAVLEMMSVYARQQLPDAAVEELMVLLDDYLAFKESAQALRTTPMIAREAQTPAYQYQMLQDTFAQLKLLRRTHMSSEAVTAFFADEETYAEYSLARMKVTTDPNLSTAERQQQLSALVWQLPPGLQQTVIHKQKHQQQVQQTNAIMNAELSDAQKRQQLALLHSEPMADRIMQHSNNKASWQQRFSAYQQEKQLLSERHASEEEYQSLLQRYFPTAQEQTIAETFTAQQR